MQPSKRLKIGVSGNFFYPDPARSAYRPKTLIYAEEGMMQWIAEGGALPVLVPRPTPTLGLEDIVAELDGIVFSGGADVCPRSYGEQALRPEWEGDYERDQYEIALFRAAMAAGKPILGICRGHQLINVALGGSLYQDTATQEEGTKIHRDGDIYDGLFHDVEIDPSGVLGQIFDGTTCAKINSVHHQAVKDLGQGLCVMARSIPDRVIEAIWLDEPGRYVMGIQWHPEWVKDKDMLDSSAIRAHFFDAVQSVNFDL